MVDIATICLYIHTYIHRLVALSPNHTIPQRILRGSGRDNEVESTIIKDGRETTKWNQPLLKMVRCFVI